MAEKQSRIFVIHLPDRQYEETRDFTGNIGSTQDFGFERELQEKFGDRVKVESGVYGDDFIKKTSLQVPEELLNEVVDLILRHLRYIPGFELHFTSPRPVDQCYSPNPATQRYEISSGPICLFLVWETTVVDTTSGHTPWHDESGREFHDYYLVYANKEKFSQAGNALEVTLDEGGVSTIPFTTKALEVTKIYDPHDLVYSPNLKELRFEEGQWRTYDRRVGSYGEHPSTEIDRFCLGAIEDSLKHISRFLGLELTEEDLLTSSHQGLLDKHAKFCGQAGHFRLYSTSRGFVILG
jgi:hypothetical protein